MSPPPKTIPAGATLPGKGERVVLDLPGGPWTTVVERTGENGVLILSPPRLGGRSVPLPLKRSFTVNWTVREIPCEVDAYLHVGPTTGGDGFYEAHVTSEPRRMQRRGAVRVPVNLIVHAQLAEDEEAEPVGALTENLSAGGALIRLARPIDVGKPFPLVVHCGGSAGDLELTARAVRCDHVEEGGYPWRVALAFIEVTSAQEDALVRFVFERQREIRRREAGLD